MRRKDKEITDGQLIDEILLKADIIRFAMVDDGEPYLVAMNFVYMDGCLYMHSAKAGRKIDILNKNNKVAFQVDNGVEILPNQGNCGCGVRYTSVFGTGKAEMTYDFDVKKKVFDSIMAKHTGITGMQYNERAFENTIAIKVEIDFMTGKKSTEVKKNESAH